MPFALFIRSTSSIILFAYLLPPFFLLHILWLFASAGLMGKPITQLIKEVAVTRDDVPLPHPPGFLPFDYDSSSDDAQDAQDGCALDDAASISSGSDTVRPAIHEPPMAEALDPDELYVMVVLKPSKQSLRGDTTQQCSHSGPPASDALALTHRRPPPAKLVPTLRKFSSQQYTRRISSTPSSKEDNSVFHRVSAALRRKQPEPKNPVSPSRSISRPMPRITGVKNGKFF